MREFLLRMADPTQQTPAPRDPILDQEAKFVHLHCHSEYSSLDGGAKVGNYAAACKARGMHAVALTDHGIMQGLPEFYQTLRAEGVKPILGMEGYLTEDRHDKSRGTKTWHITLLAENSTGYHNLCKLSSAAFMEGTILTFGRPRARADWELLERHAEGVIAFTGCMAGPVMSAIYDGDLSLARQRTEQLIAIYGQDNVYGEIQNVGIIVGIPGGSEIAQLLGKQSLDQAEAAKYDEVEVGEVPLSQIESSRILVDHICKPLGLKYVATGDVHYLEMDDADPHDSMICIGTGQLKRGARRFSLLPKRYHLRTEEEMREALGEWPEAIEETVQVALRCNAEIDFGRELLPRFPLPEGFTSSRDYLRHLCETGLDERYPSEHELRQQALERLDEELGTIDGMGFNDYFLIVWDLFNEANKRAIPSGPGRGSAAGAIVAYCLDITKICPLENKLLFERFLNPGRRSMPDIDMDFGVAGREELIEYARDKYNALAGCDTAVSQIVTFGKFKAKGALRDAARVLADPDEEGRQEALKLGDRLAKMVPDDPGMTMRKAWEESDELRRAYKAGGLQADIIQLAGWLEGFVRTNGIHAAAVIIADHDLTDDLPLQRFGPDKPLHTQYAMGHAEQLGLLKMDFLGLRNLDVIWDTVDKLRHTRGLDIHPYKDISLDDKETYEMFSRGESVGTFQFESSGMQGALKEVKPTEFNDLVALVALYRPGPMQNIPVYAARKHGREETIYPEMPEELVAHLEEIQGETYAITVYQEQSMLIARALAGFTPAEADDLRKAIGKKLRDKMDALKGPFMKGCGANGVPPEVAKELWDDNERSADYSFNKSHAACYAYLAYITGYLKCHHPHEYMASLLTSVMGKKDEPRLYLTEAKRMGLEVLPPDINRSLRDFAVLEDEESGEMEILFGLTALRGVGTGIVQEIRREREARGPFTSMFDLIRRMPHLNKTQLQALIKGGALDSFGESRKAMHDRVEETLKEIRKEIAAKEKNFVRAIQGRVEETQDVAVDGISEQKGRNIKLTASAKKGIEGAAKAAWAAHELPAEEELGSAIIEALKKDRLTSARREAKAQLAASHDDEVAGISGEEQSGSSERERVEAIASARVEADAPLFDAQRDALLKPAGDAIAAELKEREEAMGLEDAIAGETDPILDREEWEEIEKLNLERGVLGIYVTGHPLESDAGPWKYYVNRGDGRELGAVASEDIGQTIRVVGALVGKTPRKMRSGETMYSVVLEDLSGTREVAIFPRTLEGGLESLLDIGTVICMEAGVQEDSFRRAQEDDHESDVAASDAPIKLIASRIYRWDPERVVQQAQAAKPINIEISQEHFSKGWVDRLRSICTDHPGSHPVRLVLDGKHYKTELQVEPSPELAEAIKTLLRQSGAVA